MRQPWVAARYAKALFEVARETHQTAIVSRELCALVTMYERSPDLREFFARPSLPRAAKRHAALEMGQRSGLSKLTADFLALVAERGRASHVTEIVEKFEKLVDADLERVRVRVRSASLLTDERERLGVRLATTLQAEVVEMNEVVDRTLSSGFVVENDTIVLDGSVRGQLQTIRRRLESGTR